MKKYLYLFLFCLISLNASDTPKTPCDWYNTGHAAYKDEKLNNAYTAWLVAYHQACRDGNLVVFKAAQKGLAQLAEELDQLPEIESRLWLMDNCQRFAGIVPFWFWCLMSLLIFSFLCGVLVLWGTKRSGLLFVFGVAWLLLQIPIIGLYKYNTIKRGIIIDSGVELLSGPDKTYSARCHVGCGDQGVITQERDGWYLIHTKSGKGWGNKKFLVQIGCLQ
ncbi:MAG TPA: hypothetical protein QGF02_03055 [Candidatus Babeliales bacterium]|nr:hypothetical protein [Candidatus Babeliales bacterium]